VTGQTLRLDDDVQDDFATFARMIGNDGHGWTRQQPYEGDLAGGRKLHILARGWAIMGCLVCGGRPLLSAVGCRVRRSRVRWRWSGESMGAWRQMLFARPLRSEAVTRCNG
jgi:hypothetical protein